MAGEKPAARLTDMHVCPAEDGPVPHVGGPILGICCPTVLVNKLPAARVTDFGVCIGPPDPIVLGSFTVLIGKLPAARMGDMTTHGGVIVTGSPNVLIGTAGGAGAGGGGGGPANATPCAKLADALAMAALCDHTYDPTAPVPPGYTYLDPDTKEGAAALAKLGLTKDRLSPNTSDFRAQVFERQGPASGQYVVAFKGTTSRQDWQNNLEQGVGMRSDYYDRAQSIAQTTNLTSGGQVSFTGHSLGGGLASAAAVSTGQPATTFNAAGLSKSTVADPKPAAVDAYYVDGDVLSGAQDNHGAIIGGAAGGMSALGPVGEAAGAALAGYGAGRELRGDPLMPSAYGARHKLPAVRPPGQSLVNRTIKHGMPWVRNGLLQERKDLGCG
jgi:uncharacterized Zn-binding protein involved in type VI secretion